MSDVTPWPASDADSKPDPADPGYPTISEIWLGLLETDGRDH
ncbi:hypothetical protein [Microlunatus sp. Gsoil 973]|nr:hypothetical protein [Microlunatus sp. Gsoil 973]